MFKNGRYPVPGASYDEFSFFKDWDNSFIE